MVNEDDPHNGIVYPTIHHLFEHKKHLEQVIKEAFELVIYGQYDKAADLLKRTIENE